LPLTARNWFCNNPMQGKENALLALMIFFGIVLL